MKRKIKHPHPNVYLGQAPRVHASRCANLHSKYSGSLKRAGFSLVEVLLALFLVAMVIGIASEVAGNSVRNVTSLKESTFARWVALNQIEGYKIEIAQGATPSAGGDTGESEMGNMSWRWVREVTSSSSDTLLEVRVSVFRADDLGDDDPVIMVKGYVPAI